jgi:hypothetical protein
MWIIVTINTNPPVHSAVIIADSNDIFILLYVYIPDAHSGLLDSTIRAHSMASSAQARIVLKSN